MIGDERFEKVEIASAAELRAWLEAHHARDEGVWLVTWKKRPGAAYVSREEVLDELVAFGWTDGLRRKLDAERTMQLISPRRTQVWAQSYRDRAARLIGEGRMHAAGLAEIEAAKASGRWEALADVDALVVPEDLGRALGARGARAAFDGLAPSYRRNVLRWIAQARRPATRAVRVARVAEATARGEKVPQM